MKSEVNNMLKVSEVLFKNNVPVEEAKLIGSYIERLIKDKEELNAKTIIMEKYLELIVDLSYDYDGCNSVDGLKELIDELKKYANLGRVCNLSEAIFQDGSSSYNILHEKITRNNE